MSGCGGEGLCSSNSGGTGGGCHRQQQQQHSAAAAPQALSSSEQAGSFGSWVRRKASKTDSSPTGDTHDAPDGSGTTQQQQVQQQCMKCKAAPAVTHIRQQEPYCHACIEAGVCQKARAAAKSLCLLSAGDRALLALSGGAASAALLYCMASMQAPPGTTRPVKGKVAFDLVVLHISDCSPQQPAAAAAGAAPSGHREPPRSETTPQQQLRAQLAALTAAAGYQQRPLLLQLSDVFCSQEELQLLLTTQQQQQLTPLNSQQPPLVDQQQLDHQPQPTPLEQQQAEQQQQQRQEVRQQQQPSLHTQHEAAQQQQQQQEVRQQRLQALVSAVGDATGRQDLVTYLRELLLQRAAAALCCNRLLLGDCGSKLAVRIIAAAAKGRGYSLPADLQMWDGRLLPSGGPCVLLPMREVTYKELQELCSFKGLPLLPQQPPGSSEGVAGGRGDSSSNINALSERFVRDMESSLPASVYTIIRTAGHLQPFGFNDPAAMLPQAAEALAKRQHHHTNNKQQKQQQQQQQQQGSRDDQKEGEGTGGGGVAAQLPQQQWQLCGICRAPLPPQQQQQHASAAVAAVPAASTQLDSSNGSCSSSSGGSVAAGRRLCYSCNRQILQQVRPLPEGQGGAGCTTGAEGLEARLQRLKQLLPPGILLESDDDAGDAS